MSSITLAQAALLAAIAMALLAGSYFIDTAPLLNDAPALVLLGSALPSLVWSCFFFAVNRSPRATGIAAWITLVFAVLLEAGVTCIRFQQSVNYWTPWGGMLNLSGWLLRIGWTIFLIPFALAPDHTPDKRTRRVALALAILSAPSALSTAFNGFNSGIGFFLGDIPKEAFWRVVITPVIRTVYWLSQILFLWTAWKSPLRQSSAQFAPEESPSREYP